MDTGEGRFERFEALDGGDFADRVNQLRRQYPKSRGIFQVGEVVMVKGSRLQVERINNDRIIFKLLPVE